MSELNLPTIKTDDGTIDFWYSRKKEAYILWLENDQQEGIVRLSPHAVDAMIAQLQQVRKELASKGVDRE